MLYFRLRNNIALRRFHLEQLTGENWHVWCYAEQDDYYEINSFLGQIVHRSFSLAVLNSFKK